MRSQLRLFRRGFGGDHFCGFVAVPIIVASSFWLPGLSTDGNVCGWASNHQDYRRSPSDYSKLAFPSYSWPRLDSLVLISLTANSTTMAATNFTYFLPDASFNDTNGQGFAATKHRPSSALKLQRNYV